LLPRPSPHVVNALSIALVFVLGVVAVSASSNRAIFFSPKDAPIGGADSAKKNTGGAPNATDKWCARQKKKQVSIPAVTTRMMTKNNAPTGFSEPHFLSQKFQLIQPKQR